MVPALRFLLICVSVFSLPDILNAQEFGGNPPSVKWQQVNNPAARVIFPRGLDSLAIFVAGIVQQLNTGTRNSIGNKLQKINIIFQQETTVSNAHVSLGPFRSEFYLTPLQNSFSIGSLPWLEQLAIHEYRHVQQNNNFNVGLSRAFRIIFGQEGQALANSLVIPDWFYEGDAVFNETHVSPQGRGRLPYFFNDYRSLWAAGINYSWMKLRNGSLRDFTPDHYRLGYIMVAYGREKYGEEFWKRVTHDAASYKGLLYPFQQSIKKQTGKSYRVFRNDAFDFFKASLQPEPIIKTGRQIEKRHFLGDDEYPACVNDSSVIFTRRTYKQLPAFIIREGNRERKIRTRDVSLDSYFSYRSGKIVYASYRPDLRWAWRSFNEIQLLDITSGRQRRLTHRSRYFSPDISEDGTTIVAVNVAVDGSSSLHFLSTVNGSLVRTLPNQRKYFYSYPKFYHGNQVVSTVRNGNGQMSVVLDDPLKGTTELLVPFSYQVMGFPFISGDTVFFTASHGGSDRLFAVSIEEKKVFSVETGTGGGDYAPVVNASKIIWSNFTSVGFRINEKDRASVPMKYIPSDSLARELSDMGIAAVEKNPVNVLAGSRQLTVSRYSKAYRLVNFHSLRPLIDDPVYSFSLIGENVLNTLQSELFASYNRNEKSKQLGFNATYGAWFPFISGGITYTGDRRGLYRNQRIYWNELELRGGASLPLNFSKGRNFTRVNLGSDFVYNQPTFRGSFKDTLGDRSFGYINSYFTFSNQVQQARQHIYPRFAQTVLINFKKALYNFSSRQFLATGNLYLPGFAVNHNLVLTGSVQFKDSLNQRSFSNNFPFSRGYTAENFYRMRKGGINYHIPLAYPDAGFANIVYLLRVRSNLFYDHTVVSDSRLRTANFRSAGTEIFFDTKWWNQLPLAVGFRYSYLLDRDLFGSSGNSRFEIVLPVNLLDQ